MTTVESHWLIMNGGEGGDHTTLTDFEVILLKSTDCDGATQKNGQIAAVPKKRTPAWGGGMRELRNCSVKLVPAWYLSSEDMSKRISIIHILKIGAATGKHVQRKI